MSVNSIKPLKSSDRSKHELPSEKSDKPANEQIKKKQVGGVVRAIRLLDLLVSEGPLRFAEIEDRSGLPKATLHRMLNDLIDERFVIFDERALSYNAGYRILEMANRVWTRSDIRMLARDQLLALSALTGETVQIAVHADTHVVVIDHVESTQSVRLSISVGNKSPVYCSGTGKVMLAWCDAQRQESIISRISFARYTPNTVTSLPELHKDLALISKRGYALDLEESFIGTNSIAAPIVDHGGQAIAGISITAPTFRVGVDELVQWKESLIAAAAEVSRRLAPRAGGSMDSSIN